MLGKRERVNFENQPKGTGDYWTTSVRTGHKGSTQSLTTKKRAIPQFGT